MFRKMYERYVVFNVIILFINTFGLYNDVFKAFFLRTFVCKRKNNKLVDVGQNAQEIRVK